MKYTLYTDQMDNVPVTSRRGKKYLTIMCDVDRNSVLIDPMKNGNEKLIICTYQTLHKILKKCSIKIETHKLDYEILGA